MDKQFSEELIIPNNKKNFNIYLLIILILIVIISVTAVIILSIKLKDKSDKCNDLEDDLAEKTKELNNLYNQYSLQNDSLNSLFNSLQILISSSNISNSIINQENYTNVTKVVNDSKNLEDGTYDFVTKKSLSFDDGYSVAFETFSRNSENYYTDEEYDNIVYRLSCLFGSDANIGVYDQNPHISFYIKDKNISLAVSAIFNQKSIWDWKNNDIILNTFHQSKYY